MEVAIEGGRLWCEVGGAGDAVVLVHGSWGNHGDWDAVAPALAARHTVVACDRRGHGKSVAAGSATVHRHAADLAALLEALGRGPVHVLAHSYGANVALRTAALRPELFRALAVHEPPLVRLVDPRGPLGPALRAFDEGYAAIARHLRAGRWADAARTFVDDVALGPGAWAALSPRARAAFVRSAPGFRAEVEDADALDLSPAALSALSGLRAPVLISEGGRSPPLYAAVADRLAAALPRVTRHTFAEAGHVPHLSHPSEYAARIEAFLAAAARAPG